mmetsp:Transcript_25191/g.74926  ORF Transcript_25191/g.74926 Transcript_25191/m.74926 type:complete len:315 (-) Transcript_25191:44-988(-)
MSCALSQTGPSPLSAAESTATVEPPAGSRLTAKACPPGRRSRRAPPPLGAPALGLACAAKPPKGSLSIRTELPSAWQSTPRRGCQAKLCGPRSTAQPDRATSSRLPRRRGLAGLIGEAWSSSSSSASPSSSSAEVSRPSGPVPGVWGGGWLIMDMDCMTFGGVSGGVTSLVSSPGSRFGVAGSPYVTESRGLPRSMALERRSLVSQQITSEELAVTRYSFARRTRWGARACPMKHCSSASPPVTSRGAVLAQSSLGPLGCAGLGGGACRCEARRRPSAVAAMSISGVFPCVLPVVRLGLGSASATAVGGPLASE